MWKKCTKFDELKLGRVVALFRPNSGKFLMRSAIVNEEPYYCTIKR